MEFFRACTVLCMIYLYYLREHVWVMELNRHVCLFISTEDWVAVGAAPFIGELYVVCRESRLDDFRFWNFEIMLGVRLLSCRHVLWPSLGCVDSTHRQVLYAREV